MWSNAKHYARYVLSNMKWNVGETIITSTSHFIVFLFELREKEKNYARGKKTRRTTTLIQDKDKAKCVLNVYVAQRGV